MKALNVFSKQLLPSKPFFIFFLLWEVLLGLSQPYIKSVLKLAQIQAHIWKILVILEELSL